MTKQRNLAADRKAIGLRVRIAALTITLLVLTSVHHIYGGVVYGTPWRIHVVFATLPMILLLLPLFGTASPPTAAHRSTKAGHSLRNGIIAFSVIGVGLIEGGYNHALKYAVHSGHSSVLYTRLYPSPPYVPPSDFIFESTGILQFLIALSILVLLVTSRMLSARKQPAD